jgi:hypothetical protein
MRRTASGAAGNGLGTIIKYLRRATSGAAGKGLSRCRGILMFSFTISALLSSFLVNAFVANKQNGTAKVRGFGCHCVCVCVGPELARFVHTSFICTVAS